MIIPLIIFCKFISFISKFLNIGSGGTWPGEIALWVKKDILTYFHKQLSQGSILITGTNGKTTTSLMIKRILENQGNIVLLNDSGANLVNGIVSAFIKHSSWGGNIEDNYGVLEIDENSLPLVLKNLTPKIIVITNLFRDQLDRYGEVDVILEKWEKALVKLPASTTVILNADDPGVAYLGKKIRAKKVYFGIENKKYFLTKNEHATDSIFCMHCGRRLKFEGRFYSHLGIWECTCGNSRPKPKLAGWVSPLPGIYNQYNTLAAVSVAQQLRIDDSTIRKTLQSFQPAFGRQEEFKIDNKKVKIFLSKNPTGFNESLKTILGMKAKNLLLVLNDRIPDGRDISWIWDADFEMLTDSHGWKADSSRLIISGDRCYDLELRLKYALKKQKAKSKKQNDKLKLKIYTSLKEAVYEALNNTKKGESLYILPTYSAMLEVRKILIGRKIL